MECEYNSCPIGIKLDGHIQHAGNRHDDLVGEFREFRKETKQHNNKIETHMQKSEEYDKLINQKITFWAKIIAWSAGSMLAVFSGILYAVWQIALWIFGVKT